MSNYPELNISYSEGGIGEEISFVEKGDSSYTVGQELTISESFLWRPRDMVVRSVSKRQDSTGGWTTHVQGRTSEYKYTEKAPKVTITYMSLSDDEYEEFQDAGGAGDYEAKILPSDDYGCGGWKSHEIMNNLADYLGLDIYTNLPNFDVRSYSISPTQSYFSAIVGLVSAFEPMVFIYEPAKLLLLIDKSAAGTLSVGELDVSGVEDVNVIRHYDPAPDCFRVEGVDGEYIGSKDAYFLAGKRGSTTTLTETYTKNLTGSGYVKVTTTVVYYLDERGKYMCVKSETRTTEMQGTWGEEYKRRTAIENEYIRWPADTLFDPRYVNPIPEKTTTKEQIQFEYSSLWQTYKETCTEYEYNSVWEQTGETEEIFELYYAPDVYNQYRKFDPESPPDSLAGINHQMVRTSLVQEFYTELTSESYSAVRLTSNFIWDMYLSYIVSTTTSYDVQIIAAPLPTAKPEFRKLSVFATNCEQLEAEQGISNLPAEQVSIPSPNWADVQNIYNFLYPMLSYAYSNMEVTVPQIIDPLPFQKLSSISGVQISGTGYDYYVNNYSIIKDGNGYRTVVRGEARVT